jgi:hypothetical protein
MNRCRKTLAHQPQLINPQDLSAIVGDVAFDGIIFPIT